MTGTEERLRARPTVYEGVQMRSRLEARVAYMLDTMSIDWKYEPRAYKASRGEYLPDFQIGPTTFVEAKGPTDDATLDAVFRAVAILKEALPKFDLWVMFSGGVCVRYTQDGFQLGGALWVCQECRHPVVIGSDAPPETCFWCGGTGWSSAAGLLGLPR